MWKEEKSQVSLISSYKTFSNQKIFLGDENNY